MRLPGYFWMTDPVKESDNADLDADSSFELIETDPFAGLALFADSENLEGSGCKPEPAESILGGYSPSLLSDPVENDVRDTATDVSNVQVAEEVLFAAQVEMATDTLPKHAWERGIMKSIFSDDPLEALSLP